MSPREQVLHPNEDAAEVEMRMHAAAVEREEAEREELFGDADILGDATIRGLSWSVFKLAEPGSNITLGTNGLGIYWCRLHGALDLEVLRDRLGGGTFRLIGKGTAPNGERYKLTHQVQFYGAPKAPPAPAPTSTDYSPAAAPTSTPASSTDPVVAELVLELRALRAEMRREPQPALDPFALLERLTGAMRNLMPTQNGPTSSPEKLIEFGMNMLDRGVKLAETREPGEHSIIDDISKLGPVIRDVASVMRPRPVVVRPNARPAAAPGQPVPPAQPAEAAPAVGRTTRIAAFVDTIARALARRTPAAQVAYTAEDVLADEELTWLREQTAESLLELLTAHFPQYTVFGLPAGQKFVAELIRALNMDDEQRDVELGTARADVEAGEGDGDDGDEPEGDEVVQ